MNEPLIPLPIVKLIDEKRYFGRMNDPVCAAYIKGACGDEMEFYLVVKNNVIEDIKFCTDGCIYTIASGTIVAHLVVGRSINEALRISPAQVIDALQKIPREQHHCAILAVSTLYKAIADYLLKK